MNRRDLLRLSGFAGLCGLLPVLPVKSEPKENKHTILIEFPNAVLYNDDMEPISEGPLTITIVNDAFSY